MPTASRGCILAARDPVISINAEKAPSLLSIRDVAIGTDCDNQL